MRGAQDTFNFCVCEVHAVVQIRHTKTIAQIEATLILLIKQIHLPVYMCMDTSKVYEANSFTCPLSNFFPLSGCPLGFVRVPTSSIGNGLFLPMIE